MIYLDNSATTRPCAAAIDAANAAMRDFGNPSSLHGLGIKAQEYVDDARRAAASALDCREDEIYFTSGGTEGNNTAIIGASLARKKRGNRVVISAVEHDSVIASAKYLEDIGFEVAKVAPKRDGCIDTEKFAAAIDEKTVLVSCMLVNNETGAVFPVEKLKGIIEQKNAPALLHTDAVQALGKMKLSVKALGCDLLTVSAHKIHGIKGAGALYIKKGVTVRPRSLGGHQERGFRAGTEAVPAIAAFGAAINGIDLKDAAYIRSLKAAFVNAITQIPFAVINSPSDASPYIINFSLPGYKSETLLHALEGRGIYVSSGSACKKGELSHVLLAQGLPRELADSAVRVSLDRENTEEDARLFGQALFDIVSKTAHDNSVSRKYMR